MLYVHVHKIYLKKIQTKKKNMMNAMLSYRPRIHKRRIRQNRRKSRLSPSLFYFVVPTYRLDWYTDIILESSSSCRH